MKTATRNLERCGFVCPQCSFRLLLSDLEMKPHVVEFKEGATSCLIECPECGGNKEYTKNDLIFFAAEGKEIRVALITTFRKAS